MKEILNILVENGYEAYIVGGYVRDYLLGINSYDIDICTNAPIETISKLYNAIGQEYKKYYAYHINKDDYTYTITTFRKEHKYKNNKPVKISIASDLKTDLLRRDFTINTLSIDGNGKLVDLLGGMKDLNSKIIRVVGDTKERFIEDKTRIIRAIRFYCVLDFDLSKEIIDFLSSNNSSLINEVPLEYKKRELDKIFDGNNSHKFFFLIKRYNLDKYFNINLYKEPNKLINTYNKYGIWAQIECDLPFTKKEKKIINNIKKLVDKGKIDISDLSKYDNDVLYNAASILKLENKLKILKEISSLHSIIDIDLDIDIMIKYVDVTHIKRVYRDIERKIIEGYLQNNSESIIEYLRNIKYE